MEIIKPNTFLHIPKKNNTFDTLFAAIKTFHYLQVSMENRKRYVSWCIINKSLPFRLPRSPILRFCAHRAPLLSTDPN